MEILIEFTPTETYYQELYSQWLKRTKWKKWEPLLAVIFLVLGIGLYFLNSNPDLWFLPLFLIGLSLYELFSFYYSKQQWLKARLQSGVVNQVVKMTFSEENILSEGPFSTGNIKWEGIQSTKLMDKGLFLIIENGISIYLPKQVFASESEILWIVDQVAKAKEV